MVIVDEDLGNNDSARLEYAKSNIAMIFVQFPVFEFRSYRPVSNVVFFNSTHEMGCFVMKDGQEPHIFEK
jgi:hypothetical protein